MPPATPPPYDTPQPPAESVLRFHLEGRRVLDVRPEPSASDSAPLRPVWDVTGPFHVLTAWNPGGRPTTLEENWVAHQQLLTAVPTGNGVASLDAAIYAPDLSWADRAVAYTEPGRRRRRHARPPLRTAVGLAVGRRRHHRPRQRRPGKRAHTRGHRAPG